MKVGQFTINYLDGGYTHMDGGAIFGVVPKPLWSRKINANEKNQIPQPTHPILIQTKDKNIIIDTGIGNGKLTEKQLRNYGVSNESHLEDSLQDYNLTAADIDIVLMTHMHFDHATGLTNEEGEAVFPNATHYIQSDEWDEFLNPNIRSKATYWSINQGNYKDKVVEYKDEISPYPGITMKHTGGHSNGHSIITIESENDKAVHMADIFPTHAHQNSLWVTAYDDYPMDSISEKEKYIHQFIKENYWFLYYHDPKYFAVKFDSSDEKIIEDFITRNI
ncbi:MBL fold metallo-hydrolase [Staphylococcus sp. SQ8-PEA]|uniref:MBL fold metallo-hydrolase n=1 Tax=Staphylococcus marylandisciuri TaxID=2981529 RepID=A0ABT2QQ81_9STAP|nr:MBL fold metallo-hydrolase [Staphylococcus marylandisciuri]MCU5746136.1 MBL fold metallo-hydrolase [Staphylococcus marylandisciuri]